MTIQAGLFQANNHSVYTIGWKDISPELTQELMGLISQHYDIVKEIFGTIKEVDEWERMSNNFRVPVVMFGCSSNVLLRKHINLKDEASCLLLGKVMKWLCGEGISIPEILSTREGKDIFFHEGHHYQLYEFKVGNHYRGTITELVDIARRIAYLHTVLAKMPRECVDEIAQKKKKVSSWSHDGWKKMFDFLEARTDDMSVRVRYQKMEILQMAYIVESQLQRLPPMRMQVIRNSLHPHDTLYDSHGDFVSFLDFEEIGVGELVRDVANACHRFVRQYIVHRGGDWRLHLHQALATFLLAYTEVNPLTKEEIRLFPLFIRVELLRKLYSDVSKHALENNPSKLEDGEFEKKILLLREASMIEQGLHFFSSPDLYSMA